MCHIWKLPTCLTAHSRPHSHFPDVLHQERIHPCTRFFLPKCHIRNKHTIARSYSSSSVTSGNQQPAPEPTPGHIPIFPMCYIRSENTLAHAYFYSSIISGMMMGVMRTMGSKEWPVRQVAMVLCCKSSSYVWKPNKNGVSFREAHEERSQGFRPLPLRQTPGSFSWIWIK